MDAVVRAASADVAGETLNVGATEFGTVRSDLEALIAHAGSPSRPASRPGASGRGRAARARAAAGLAARGVALPHRTSRLVRRRHTRARAARLGAAALERARADRDLRLVPRQPRDHARGGRHAPRPVEPAGARSAEAGLVTADDRLASSASSCRSSRRCRSRRGSSPCSSTAGSRTCPGIGPIGVAGVVGADLSVEEGYEAARATALLALRRIVDELGELERVDRWVKVLGFVRSAPGFGDQPAVAERLHRARRRGLRRRARPLRAERDRRLRAPGRDPGRGRGRARATLNGHDNPTPSTTLERPASPRSPTSASASLLYWDQQVMMPRRAPRTAARSRSRRSTGWRTSSSSPRRPAACSTSCAARRRIARPRLGRGEPHPRHAHRLREGAPRAARAARRADARGLAGLPGLAGGEGGLRLRSASCPRSSATSS